PHRHDPRGSAFGHAGDQSPARALRRPLRANRVSSQAPPARQLEVAQHSEKQVGHRTTINVMHAVQLTAVTKTFGGVRAVDDLSLTVREGSVFGFIGPNGSGKTTTIRMIVNIFYPDRGAVSVFGAHMTGSRT